MSFLFITSLWAQNPSVPWAHFGGGEKHDYLVASEVHPSTGWVIEIFETQSRDLFQTGEFACDSLISCCDSDYNFYIRIVDPVEKSLVAARYYGGAGDERKPSLFLYGDTLYLSFSVSPLSGHLATLPAHVGQTHQGGLDVGLVAFEIPSLENLKQTFRGGSGTDLAGGIVVDTRGVFVSFSSYQNSYFPVFNGGEANHGKYDAGVFFLSHDFSRLYFSGHFGGLENDGYDGDDMPPVFLSTADSDNLILVTESESNDIANLGNGYWEPSEGADIFSLVLEVKTDNRIIPSVTSLFGGNNDDHLTAIKVQNSILYGVGYTEGDFPSGSIFYHVPLGTEDDIFVFALSPNLQDRYWSYLIGGEGDDRAYAVELIPPYVFVGGESYSDSLSGLVDTYQLQNHGEGDGVVFRLQAGNIPILKSSFLGGAGTDGIRTLLWSPEMQSLLAGGYTGSPFDFPTDYGGLDPSHSGFMDGFDFAFGLDLQVEGTTTDIGEETIPTEYSLSQNYPNPFNPTTTISFSLPEATQVSIKIYDMLGREVSSLLHGNKVADGTHVVTWDASRFSSGTYFYRIQAGDFVSMKKMILLK
ncbi:T9SS type A sorting domain-containing protein [Candidatus Gracilibacteria bacterium]|nr:T9SS type A sorting domain-containing protein [Candidatus Gracilibacteria bacterium]